MIEIIVLKRCLSWLLILLFLNIALVAQVMPGKAVAILVGMVLAAFYAFYSILPYRVNAAQRRLGILRGGYELALAAIVCFTLELAIYLYILVKAVALPPHLLIINAVTSGILLLLLLLNGIIRMFTCSAQLGVLPRVLLLLFWWVPIANFFLLRKFLSVSGAEYNFTLESAQRNADRKHEQLCKTQYPILMVHGIFFRDWKNFNYWGRVPKVLEENGAVIHYGSHQSSASVEQCAQELQQCITDIVRETGCEKVNIIAHSKGGLDARYAISVLGMAPQVASLTSINTPHLGCNYVRKLLRLIPQKSIAFIGKKYESLYTKLGDDNPDFFSGLQGLTDQECARLGALMPDDPDILYQSVASRMKSHSSAMFPLNVGYGLIKFFGGGDNDGLVSTASMAWGDFLGVLSTKSGQGISHGDMIDLTRKNIPGFDVCEFYVDLVSKLKLRGL